MDKSNQKKKEKSNENVERFYEWMLRINNKFLSDNAKMEQAFNIVANG